MSLNIVVLQGNVTRDPELAYTAGGMPVVKFGIAVNHSFKKQGSDDWTEEVSFLEVVAFGQLAERAAGYVVKGNELTIKGRLQQERWETQDGQKRSMVKVVAEKIPKPRGARTQSSSSEDADEEYYA